MSRSKMSDVIVLLPGIIGSVLKNMAKSSGGFPRAPLVRPCSPGSSGLTRDLVAFRDRIPPSAAIGPPPSLLARRPRAASPLPAG